MIIIGHPWVESSHFVKVNQIEEIRHTKPNEVLVLSSLSASHAIASHCQTNGIPYAILAANLLDALFANSLGAKYIICERTLATQVQTAANVYLFDSRILTLIQTQEEIEAVAKEGIDGVIFSHALAI
jgi:hypothetical protein